MRMQQGDSRMPPICKKVNLAIAVIMILLSPMIVHAQSYKDSILGHRQHYKEEFITEERSPLKGNDTSFLRFYEPSEKYRVVASFESTSQSEVFDMPTHSGKTKKFKQYGIATFRLSGKTHTLHIYQNQGLLKDPKYKDELFIPFTDATTYAETYGGGRYIDLSINDIRDNTIIIDFNKCYNPYCAYAEGYNCPIPPAENRLKVSIKAGEKLFAKEH